MEEDIDKFARYLNELKYSLQDELSPTSPRIVEECYQLAIKVEDKLRRRQEMKSRGRRRNFRGRGSFSDSGQSHESEGETSNAEEQTSNLRGGFRGRRSDFRGRFESRGGSSGITSKCYKCNKFVGHQAWKCTKE